MDEHVVIRKYREEDHEDVRRIFAQGVYENVGKGMSHGLSKPKVIVCLAATFALGFNVSTFHGCISLLIGLSLYSLTVFLCYNLYAR